MLVPMLPDPVWLEWQVAVQLQKLSQALNSGSSGAIGAAGGPDTAQPKSRPSKPREKVKALRQSKGPDRPAHPTPAVGVAPGSLKETGQGGQEGNPKTFTKAVRPAEAIKGGKVLSNGVQKHKGKVRKGEKARSAALQAKVKAVAQ